jgi:hypothetical protein
LAAPKQDFRLYSFHHRRLLIARDWAILLVEPTEYKAILP